MLYLAPDDLDLKSSLEGGGATSEVAEGVKLIARSRSKRSEVKRVYCNTS